MARILALCSNSPTERMPGEQRPSMARWQCRPVATIAPRLFG